jgi:hypothetical protein
MYQIKLFGELNKITEDVNGLVDVTSLGTNHITLDCYFLNFEYDKLSEKREISGSIFVDDNIYRYGFAIVTERYSVANFGVFQSDLIEILRSNYLYCQVLSYEFEPFADTKAMPFVVSDYSINFSKGYKWFTMKLEKVNGKT